VQPYPTLTLHALANGRRTELPHWPRAGMNRRSPETAPSLPLSDCARMTGLCCTGSFARLFAMASRLGT